MSLDMGSKKGSTVPSEDTFLSNPITFYKQRTGKYPSNAQVWWSMKRPPEVGTDRPPKTYLEVFDPGLRYQVSTGNTPVAKGHYLINAFQQDRSSVSGIPGLDVESSHGARPQAVAFFAGRAFYAGVFAAGFNTKIYFSQILERPEQVGQCFQEYDPTTEEIRDLLPSDGGVIVIPEVTEVHHMQAYGQSLYVFADNGVWVITGSQGIGFRANDYSVTKLSGVPTISNLSFTSVEGVPIWWNRSSINTLAPGQTGDLTVVSLTDNTIKSLFEDIPTQSKFYAKGTYDPLTKKVQYLYRSTETADPEELFLYDKVLVLDTRTGSWSPWTPAESPRVQLLGLFSIDGEAVLSEIERVVVGTDTVVADLDDVYSILIRREILESKVKYIVNVLSDEVGIDPPPDPAEIPPTEVFVSDDNVLAGTDNVVITP